MLSEKIKNSISESLDMPKDIVMDLPKLVLNGDIELFCSGYKALREYSEKEIKIISRGKVILVRGEKLAIKSIECEEIVINGKISAVEFI